MSNREAVVTHLSSVARTGDAQMNNPSPVARGAGSWRAVKRNHATGAHSFRGGATNRREPDRNDATRSLRVAVSTNDGAIAKARRRRQGSPACGQLVPTPAGTGKWFRYNGFVAGTR